MVRQASRMAMQWGFAGGVVMALAFAVFGPAIIDLMTTAPEVRAEARDYLAWMVAAPLIGVAAWIYDGIFIGATLTREMRRAMTFSVGVYAVALAVLVPLFGNHGLWAALVLFFAVRGVTMARAFPAAEAKASAA